MAPERERHAEDERGQAKPESAGRIGEPTVDGVLCDPCLSHGTERDERRAPVDAKVIVSVDLRITGTREQTGPSGKISLDGQGGKA